MSCKSALYAVNTNAQNVSVNGIINFGSIIRRFGQHLNLVDGNAVAKGQGYYEGNVNVNFTGSAGTTTISLFANGVAIVGATVSLTTEASTNYQVNIPFIVRNFDCVPNHITAMVTGQPITTIATSIEIEKM